MRILLSCLQSLRRHPLPAYEFWRAYFVEGCREAAIECVEVPNVDWAEGLLYSPGEALRAWRTRTWETVLAFARSEHARKPIDFFLGYLSPKQVEAAAISDLQGLGIPCVNFFCDNVREFWRVPNEYRPFALHWVPEFEALSMYQKADLPHLHMPMPCWVPIEFRSIPTAETEPPTFIGSADILRRDLLGRAFQSGADFVVRGPGWKGEPANGPDPRVLLARSTGSILANQWEKMRSHGCSALIREMENRLRPFRSPPVSADRLLPPVFGLDYSRVTREATLTIGVNRVPTLRTSNRHPLSYSRLRDIEAPMLGACYLTEWTAGLGELYELGTEIESYRTSEELAAKVTELKHDSARRRRLRKGGQRRALVDHTVTRSLHRISGRWA